MNEIEKLEFELCPFCGVEVSIATEKYGIMFMCRCCLITFSFHDVKDLEEAVERFNRRTQLDREADGWIETENTPPDDIGLWVWAYSVDGKVMLAKYVGEGIYHADNGMKYWGEYFTHWMPANIPEPPKEERHEL